MRIEEKPAPLKPKGAAPKAFTYEGQCPDDILLQCPETNENLGMISLCHPPGSGALKDFTITINGNCSGTCLSSGTWSYPGSLEDARATLYGRHSFSFPGEDEAADMGFGQHAYSTQHRFGASTCPFFSCANSPHVSVPNSWVPVPKDTVPQGFHVDAHGDFYNHRQDVKRQGVE